MSFINNIIKKLIIIAITVTVAAGCFATSVFAETDNIIRGGGFESDVDFWTTYSWYDDVSELEIDRTVYRSGRASFKIHSASENDARIIQEINVSPSSYYTVTAYIKTENVLKSDAENYRVGATISVVNTMFVSSSVCGDTDWMQVEFSFRTAAKMDTVQLSFTLGGYGALNSGTAWFDDITVKKVATAPANYYQLTSSESSSSSVSTGKTNWAGYELTEDPDAVKWIAFAFVWFIVLAILAIAFAYTGDITGDTKKLRRVFVFSITGAVLFRIAVAMLTPAYASDLSCFKYWSWYASKDLFNMYSSSSGISFLDYPPLYMYILAPLGAMANGLSEVMDGAVTELILKLPSLVADIVTSVLLYRLAKRYLDDKWAVVVGLFYALNPAIWINSVAWGQVDSLFTMFIVIELMCILYKKWAGAGISFALMVLMKPHGIIFTPAIGLVLLLEIIFNKNWKPMLITVLSGVLAVIVLLLPFYIRTGFEDPMWIIKLYTNTIDSYPYVSMNAFNFWAMLGYNVASVEKVWCGLKFSQWGMLGIILAIVLAIIFAVKGMQKKALDRVKTAMPAIVSCILIVTVFTFAAKMHERYMFAAIVLALMSFILSKEKWYLYLSVIFSSVIFANTYMIYNLNTMWDYPYPAFDDITVNIIALFEFLSFIALMIVTVKVMVKKDISAPKSLSDEQNVNKGE